VDASPHALCARAREQQWPESYLSFSCITATSKSR
jgi:hypothetical protein